MTVILRSGYHIEHNFSSCNKRTVVANVSLIANVIQSYRVEQQYDAHLVLT